MIRTGAEGFASRSALEAIADADTDDGERDTSWEAETVRLMPSRQSLPALLFVCALSVGGTTACRSVTEPSSPEFTIRVDSITGPNAVSGGVAANSLLWGTVGPNGCTAFKELQTTRVAARIDATVIGARIAGAACTTGTVALSGVVLRLDPPIANDFMIVVHQPDGSVLTRRIFGE